MCNKFKEVNSFYKSSPRKGISLITLVITIIIIIILAGAVMLSLANNNPIDSANEAVFKQNVAGYRDELLMWKTKQYTDKLGSFDPTGVSVDNEDAKYEGQGLSDIIKSMKPGDLSKFEIEAGELTYVGGDQKEKDWFDGVVTEPVEPEEDELPPQHAVISVTAENDVISGTIAVKDNESGIDYTKTKYIVTNQSTAYEPTDEIWNTAKDITQATQSISETVVNGDYYIQVLSVDLGENTIVDVSSKITVVNTGILDTGYNTTQGVNGPVLKTGMTPVKWNGTTLTTTTVDDPTWYNYTNKEWANAQTADGSLWVWIPRYEYKIPTPNTSTAQTIAINFKQGTSTAITSGYTMHPAFKFGDTELTGIWVAKFEATAREGLGNSTASDNVTTKHVKVSAGVQSWRYANIGTMFAACRNMETDGTYGWGTDGAGIDTHLMKNVEWGVVDYLSSGTYGKSGEVTINSNSSYYTGGGTGTVYTSNIAQSTTGNVYGVYDMSGGAWEYTAAYVNNANVNLATYGGNLTAVGTDAKYRDSYTKGASDDYATNYVAAPNVKGDAVYETSANGGNTNGTSSWYSDYSYMPYSSGPFFIRGGKYSNSTNAGVFAFSSVSGNDNSGIGFRPVLALGVAL